jgi:hypothetical protein
MLARIGLIAQVIAFAGACGGPETRVVVTAGSSEPPADRVPYDPFATIVDRSPVTAWEFGACVDDRDCVSDACEGAACAPLGEVGACLDSPVGECLVSIDDSLCACVEGACRWARVAPVLECGRREEPADANRGFRGYEPDWYPIPINR